MKRVLFTQKIALCTFLLTFSTLALAQGRILHSPPSKVIAGEPLPLFCQLEGVSDPVRLIRIFYRHDPEEDYQFVTMVPSGNQWKGTIPAAEVKGDRLQYFILAATQNNSVYSFPWANPKSNPEELVVLTGSEGTRLAPAILILAPEENQIIPPGSAFLAISLSTPAADLDPKSLKILLNGRDVTRHAQITEYVATFDMRRLGEGKYGIDVHATDRHGTQLPPASITFFVKRARSAARTRSNLDGRLFAEGRREMVYNSDQSFAMGGADFNGYYGSLDFQGRLFLTSLEESGAQPRDRFYLALGNDNFNVQAGDIYPRFNDLIMWGKRVRGVAGAVQAGAFRLETVFGETYRAVEGIGTETTISRYGTYRQSLFGVRPSLNFYDNVKAGFSIVKIKDDQSSIQYGTNPGDNLILGPDVVLSFDRARIELRAQAAFSVYTRDASLGSFSMLDIENIFGSSYDVPIDPSKYSNILIINDTTVPLDPTRFTSAAYDAQLKLHYFRNLLRFGYKSIGSDYVSLANSWLRKDIRGFYFSDRIRLFQNKLYAHFSMEKLRDNLAEEGTKPTSDLNSINAGFSIYPGRKLPHFNISLRDYHRANGITDIQIDSLLIIGALDTLDSREDSRQRDLMLQLGYQINFLNANHYISANYISAIRDDAYEKTRLADYFSQSMSSDIKMLSWTTDYSFPMRTTFSFSTNSNAVGRGLSDFEYSSISGFAEYRFFRERLRAFTEARLMNSNGMSFSSNNRQANRFHLRIGGMLQFPYRQSLLLEGMLISLSSQEKEVGTTSAYTDHLIRIRYEKLF